MTDTPRHPSGALSAPAQPSGEPLLGVGRSGLVFASRGSDGVPVARKVFDSDALTRVVQYVVLGASNPYAWNEHAVRAALLRRRILAPLVARWFGGRLRVARALGHGWDAYYRAYELRTELVDGRPPALHHPLRRAGKDEVRELTEDILAPLQERLAEAGFDGLLWQAGLGNPVALANFLLEVGADGARTWAWIDLESGVPALFPLHLPTLWRRYLPLCKKHGRPLFDDVDCDRLAAYVADDARGLDASTRRRLVSDVEALRFHQEQWRCQPRLARSIESQLVKGKLSAERAAWYGQRPLRWCMHEVRRAARGLLVRARGWIKRNWPLVRALPWKELPRGTLRFLVSQKFRERAARRFVVMRVGLWERRGQLSRAHADEMRLHATRETSSAWLADFAVHVAIKPVVKGIEWFVFPALLVAGVVNEATVGIAILAGGSVSRSLYTLGRVAYDVVRGREPAWIALGTGVLPVVGNLAFPLQIAYSSRGNDDLLAQFILYDGMSLVGRRLPIWGGADTLTEHVCNQLPDRVVRARDAR
jgi:hypothetical protein